MQDMAAAAVTNAPMKALLGKYGLSVQAPQPGQATPAAQPATNAVPDVMKETAPAPAPALAPVPAPTLAPVAEAAP